MSLIRRERSHSARRPRGFFSRTREPFSYAVVGGLILVMGFMIFVRGAYYRLYWAPAGALIALLFGGFLLYLNHSSHRPRFHAWTDLPLLAFLGLAFFSYFFSINPEATLFEAMRLASGVMCYFLVAYAVEREGLRKALAFGVFALGFLEASYGLIEYISGRPLLEPAWIELVPAMGKVSGTFRNHNHFAGLMVMTIFLGFGLGLGLRAEEDRATERIASTLFFLIPCGLMILALILSLSRGGWVSFVAGLIFFLGLVWWREHRVWSWLAGGVLVVALVIGSVFLGVNRSPLFKQLRGLVTVLESPEELSAEGRLSLWKSAVAMVKDHPWTGLGYGTFRSAYPAYRRDRIFKGPEFAHNDYLQIGAGLGLPGLVCFVLFSATLFWRGIQAIQSPRRRHGESNAAFWPNTLPGLLAGIFALLLHEVVDFNLLIPGNALVFFALAGMVAGWGRGEHDQA